MLLTLVLMIGFTTLIAATPLGRAQRACEQDMRMAALLGVDVDRVISLTFVMGAALAAVAGLMVTLYYGVVDFFIGFLAGVKAFTAAVLGGIGSLPGAMLGGILIGLIEAFWSGYFSVEYKDVSVFVVLVLVLVFARRPCSAGPRWRRFDDRGLRSRSRQRDSVRPAVSGSLFKDAALAALVAGPSRPAAGRPATTISSGAAPSAFAPISLGRRLRRAVVFVGRLALRLLPQLRLAVSARRVVTPVPGQSSAPCRSGSRSAPRSSGRFCRSRRAIRSDLGTTVLIYVMLGWGLNVVVGLAGLLDLGYVAVLRGRRLYASL